MNSPRQVEKVSGGLGAAAIDASRSQILAEIADPPDLTFVGGVGNRGDELIWAGTRELLADHIYTEVDLAGLCAASGHTVLLCGGGAFCRPFHDLMPRALAIAALRFERVIVLPTSFDPSEDEVREALSHTCATVFARERESYRRISSLCDARLAHDCAFFFDFTRWQRAGQGTLDAFRTDPEALAGGKLPPGNDDISLTAPSLEQWLDRIASHERIRTDRAHVMIAAALLGKQVEFAPSSYHKLDAIAEYALSDYAVTRVAPASPPPRSRGPKRSVTMRPAATRVSVIILTRDRPAQALRTIDSVRPNWVSFETLVLDNNSADITAAQLAEGCALREEVRLRRLDRNLGCAGGRQFSVETVDSEYVLFIDDDAELEPGALDLLVADLDTHPECSAVTATVLLPDGTVHHSGGWLKMSDGVVGFSLIGLGQAPSDGLPATGPAGWVPGTVALIRRDVLQEFPIDAQMLPYYEDNEWCYRVERARPGTFRRSLEARAVHDFVLKLSPGVDLLTRSRAVELLHAHARFYERHRVLLETVFDFVLELTDADGVRDEQGARLLMDLLLAKGTDWTLMEWMNGNLDTVLSGGRRPAGHGGARDRLEVEIASQRELLAYLHERHATLQRIEAGGTWRLRRRLLPVLRVYWWLRGRGGS